MKLFYWQTEQKIVVNNQWGTLFPRFLEAAKKLYQVTNDTESNTQYPD